MSTFVRRFGFDPGNEVLLEIESVNILDLDPPASIAGVGTGTVLIVGEFEDGPFETPTEVAGTSDFLRTFGELGYSYNGVKGNNPCARARKADGAITAETWNGNGFVQLNAKRFSRLVLTRVNTSVGAVEFRREAFVAGTAAFSYNLEPGQVLSLDIGAGPVNTTFNGTAGVYTSGAGTYPNGFVGGETLTLGYDDRANFVVTFLPADTTKAAVIARINQYAGFTFASDGGGQLITLTSLRRGTGASVRVVGASAAGVLTALGMAVTTVIGTGNTSDIDATKFSEVKAAVELAVAGVRVEQDLTGRLRVTKTYASATDYIAVGTATTAVALGLVSPMQGSNDGIANLRSTAGTYPIVAATGVVTLGVDDEANVNVLITTGMTQAQAITAINTALGYTAVTAISATVNLMRGRANGGQVRIVGANVAALLTNLGITIGTYVTPAVIGGTIPAGTEITNTGRTNRFVTMQTITVNAPTGGGPGDTAQPYVANVGPYTVPVRHAMDDGTGVSATGGTLTVLTSAIDLGSFSVINPQQVAAALTESAIDALYTQAFDKTLDLNSVAREVNVSFSARQSNIIRSKVRSNAIEASAKGMFGRMGIIRPPLATPKALAQSKASEPGVGAYRNQRVVYAYPQASTFVPTIALRGLSGGLGFTASGRIDIGADGFVASIMSQLPPEENPGQETPFADGVVSIESSFATTPLDIVDYTNFRRSGICALRIEDGVAIFQSGVTSVDPTLYPNLKNIARRRMADFIQDTLARRLKSFGKKLAKVVRRRAIVSEIRQFLSSLLSKDNPDLQRIGGFEIDEKSGNTTDSLAAGLFRIIVRVKTLSSLDSIVLETTIGESVVVVNELLAA